MKATNFFFVFLIIASFTISSCKKPKDIPTVTTVAVKIIPQQTILSLSFEGQIITDGNDEISSRGFCFSHEPDPSIADFNIASSSQINDRFYATASDLEDGNYYVRAYAINSQGVGYGSVIAVGEASLPVVEIVKTEVNSLPMTAVATITGRLLSNGGATISRIGVCLSKHTQASISDTMILGDLQTNYVFTSIFENLENNDKYYVRAFAENYLGISYGQECVIETKSVALAENQTPINVKTEKATLQAMVYPKNTNTTFWFEYGETPSFGQQTEATVLSGREGILVAAMITNLNSSQVYYYRTRTSNLVGENIGSTFDFETYGLEDIDGNCYRVVTIGNQVWMQENLRVTHYNDGTPIRYIADINEWTDDTDGAYCYYNNNNTLQLTYGNLYNFYVIENHPGKLAPAGWHVPTDEEWFTLAEFLVVGSMERWEVGGFMKEVGYAHWQEQNIGATNSSGFTALPGGTAWTSFERLGKNAHFWSSTAHNSQGAYDRSLWHDNPYLVDNAIYHKNAGFSIRLIKD